MSVPVQEHAYDPATEVCIYCHVPKRNVVANGAISCIFRWVDAASVARADRSLVSAVNDFDFIGARLKQLRDEHEADVAARRDDDLAALLIGSSNKDFVLFCNSVDPQFAWGRMQDGIGGIYFIARLPGESIEAFELRRRAARGDDE